MQTKLRSPKRLKDGENSRIRGADMQKSKKRKLRRKKDEELVACLEKVKKKAERQEKYIHYSFEAQEEILGEAKMERAKYLFLLREARERRTTLY
jgi:hypothetical protein